MATTSDKTTIPVRSASSWLMRKSYSQWKALLSATLECWAHSILYNKHIYPKDTFGPTRFLGVRCHVCRHPEVVSYVRDTIAVAVPALIENAADELVLYLTSENEEELQSRRNLQAYRLGIKNLMTSGVESEDAFTQMLPELERSMRDLILEVHSLRSDRLIPGEDNSISFRLQLHISDQYNSASCYELNQVFARGIWKVSSENELERGQRKASNKNSSPVIIPLHRIETPISTLDFTMERERRDGLETTKDKRQGTI